MVEIPPSLQVGKASPSEFPDVVQLYVDRSEWLAFRGIEQWPPGGFPKEVVAMAIEAEELYTATVGREVVAACRLSEIPEGVWAEVTADTSIRPWYLTMFATARAWDKRGVGEAVLVRIREIAKQSGADRLRLECPASEGPLVEYFTKQGFTVQLDSAHEGTTLFQQSLY